jgi:hypothetical protein
MPGGWERVVGHLPPDQAAVPLASALVERPDRVGELTPPFIVGVRDRRTEQLTIVNDFISAGRIYELRFEGRDTFGSDGWVWSNRLGALPIFAGVAPAPDERGWALFAAAGWFIGDATPIAGTAKVPGGSVIRAGGKERLDRQQTHALSKLVKPREVSFEASVTRAGEQAVGLARNVDASYGEVVQVDLSGGRDSRLSAAAACAAGIDCELRTGDKVPGEVEIARRLVASAPRPLRHRITTPEQGRPKDELHDRLRNLHLIHDGMRHPQDVRRPMRLPQPVDALQPALSGHGGELGHGFYYTTESQLTKIVKGGDRAVLKRLEQAGRRQPSAAQEWTYDLYRAELETILDQARGFGLTGPTLLDYFYLTQRFAFLSGLGARSGRHSVCATPGFVRAAFDLTPEDRLENRLHVDMIAGLVPEWAAIPFLGSEDGNRLPKVHRQRIWEKPGHADTLAEMIDSGSAGWTDIYRPRRVRRMLRKARAGKGHPHYEGVFERIAWRVSFEAHLSELARAARTPIGVST